MIQTLPDESTVDDIMAELYFRAKVDNGLKELETAKPLRVEKGKLHVTGYGLRVTNHQTLHAGPLHTTKRPFAEHF
jgi:hypothetical protein